jgi:hypothetical protein
MSKLHLGNINLELLALTNATDNGLDTIQLFETIDIKNPNIKQLAIMKKIKKNKLKNCYKQILGTVFKTITTTSHAGQTDIIFKIPHVSIKNNSYNPIECRLYIEKKLRKLKFDTLKIKPNSLFITWNDIDKHITN